MSKQQLRLQDILSHSPQSTSKMQTYALESFAKEIDHQHQTKLLTKLVLDHSAIAEQLEQVNQELLQSRAMLEEAQGIALLGRWDIDVSSDRIIWSPSMYDILELDSSTAPSPDLMTSIVHPDDRENVKAMFQLMFERQEPWTTRYRLLTQGGKVKWVHLRFFSEFDGAGQPLHLYGTIQDISELKKIEDELEKYNHHLEHMVEEKVQEISSSQMATIYALVKLAESRDDDTGAHIERTSNFCRLLALKLRTVAGYSDQLTDLFVDTLHRAAPLHDVGKVGIPDSILLKPGKLTDAEFSIMKTHVQIGYDTLVKVGQQYTGNEFLKMGAEIALYHHEKWDGSGYTLGLKGDTIPLSARIMALSDVYDALRSKRVYKEAFSHAKSVGIIRSSRGSHFDPTLVDVFIQHQDEFKALYDEATTNPEEVKSCIAAVEL